MSRLDLNLRLQEIDYVRELPELSGQIRHDLKHQRLDPLESGLYLVKSSSLFSTCQPAKSEYFFEDMPGLVLGRQESRHGVLFGRLGNLALSDSGEIVAVKPSDQPSQLLGELATFQYLQDKTSFPTFRPVGYLASESIDYLITEFNPSINVLGIYDWAHTSSKQKKQVVNAVSDGLGKMHANFLFHGDAFLKNLALNEKNQFFVVDPELMVSGQELARRYNVLEEQNSDSENDTVLGSLARVMLRDIGDFYRTLAPKIYKKQNLSQAEIFNFIASQILPEYKNGFFSASDPSFKDLTQNLYSVIEETLKQRFEQEKL